MHVLNKDNETKKCGKSISLKKKTEKVEEFEDETSHTSEDGRILQLAAIA